MSWLGNHRNDPDRRPVVQFVPIICPDCRTRNYDHEGTRGRIRYHRCRDCSLRFMSVEQIPEPGPEG